jgi:hypothetical protein
MPYPLPPRAREWGWAGIAAAALTAVYLIAYGDFIGRFFAFDDFAILDQAERIAAGGIAGAWRVFLQPWPSFAQYRPLTNPGWFWLLRACFGLDPTRWTMVQLAAHTLNALLVFGIARRLLRSPVAGLATALIYASAPGHALAVRWIAFFTISGTALVYFLALWTWLAAPERWRVPATTALFVTALLCSEHAASFPIALGALAVLGQGRRDARRLVRELVPVWTVGAAYLGAKLLFLYVLWPRWNPLWATLFHNGYALDFDPATAVATLGRYVGATLAPVYRPAPPAAWCRTAGAVCLVLTLGLIAAAAWDVRRRWLGITACGCALFLVGLGPTLFLPGHIYPAYVGIPALGAALALVAPLAALPRGGAVSLALAAGFVGVHLHTTAITVRDEGDFRFIDMTGEVAARWLVTLDQLAGPGTREVVVPDDGLTQRMFGMAHRQFLCASYDVVRAPDIGTARAAPPERLVIPRASKALPPPAERWRAIVHDCPH